ncbi:MAG: hypothetical protein LBI19_10825 [Oscillospiraceae bacterium]|jgi:hypothetical protein|nr:hypothetical protein [Oscillospiraceae bacterium]
MTGAFEAIKHSVNILDAAARMGVTVDRHGKALCFAHAEKTPSLSFKGNRWHCFGCGAGGDVVDMVAAIQGITGLEAAKQLDAIYSLRLFDEQADTAEIRRRVKQAQAERDRLEAFKEWERRACITWSTYCRMLESWKRDYAPKGSDDEWDSRFCDALRKLDYADYIFYEVFINGDFEAMARFYQTHRQEVKQLEQRIRQIGFTG